MLTFYLGASGTGKSRALLGDLLTMAQKCPQTRHVLLVPEQYTLQTQRDVVHAHPAHAVMNVDILSFERLASRVFAKETPDGEGGLPDILTNMGKHMLLRRACGEHEGELVVFRKNLKKPGFISRLTAMISELYQYGIGEEELAALAEEFPAHPLLERKLQDLAVFVRAMNETKGDRTIAAEELLPLLAKRLPASDFLNGAVVAVDGFTGFTTVQLQILRTIIRQAKEVLAAFTLPAEMSSDTEARPQELFYMSKAAVFSCAGLAREAGTPVRTRLFETNVRHAGSPALAHLEKYFLRGGEDAAFSGKPEGLRFLVLRSPEREAEFAAAEICRLVREEGLRYREIAVVTGDLSGYRPYIREAFGRAGIPCFMDRKRGIMGNPLVEYILSALEVMEWDFSYESVLRHCRAGILSFPEMALEELDNYILAGGIRGRSRWEKSWETTRDRKHLPDFTRLNETRERILTDLSPLIVCRKEKRRKTAERTAAIRQMIEASAAGEALARRAEILRDNGEMFLAEEYEKVCDYVLALLDEMDALLGQEALSWQEFSDILEAGLSQAKLGMLPQSLDGVVVGDVMRSRLANVRVLLVLGMNEGMIPGMQPEGGLLSEKERELLLARKDGLLAPTAGTNALSERFYLYRLFTRPSERLILLASRMSSDGSPRRLSYLTGGLRRLFPELVIEEEESLPGEIWIAGKESAYRYLARAMQEEKKETETPGPAAGWARCLREEDGEKKIAEIVDAAFREYREGRISNAAARALYGADLTGSVTRLEEYAACAAAQFYSHGLRLAERETGEWTGSVRGSFLHRTLEEFFHILKERKIDRDSLGEDERRNLTEEAAFRALQAAGISMEEQSDAERYQIRRWVEIADRNIWAVLRQLAGGDFEPEAFEMAFSGWTTEALRFRLSDEERLILQGVVDRLDVCEDGDVVWVRVIDYKSGRVSFDLNAVCAGLEMQLPFYLGAVTELLRRRYPGKTILPAGIYYHTLEDPLLAAAENPGEEERDRLLLKELTPKGLSSAAPDAAEHGGFGGREKITSEQFGLLTGYVRGLAEQFGREILDGRTSAAPYRRKDRTACDFCAFSGVCGFDPKIPGSGFRRIADLSAQKLWEKMEQKTEKKGGEA